MSAVDSRIVEIKFNNSQFLEGVRSTLSALLGLDKSLKLEGGTKGLDNIASAAKKLDLSQLGSAADGVTAHFSAMGIVAITALTNIANKAVNAGLQLAKSLTIAPIGAGLQEYETNLNAIQTILANTGLKGAEGLGKVNGALDQLNTYSDQTIYNFSEMAKNIGTFTAAGVNLDTSTAAIKGIANLAALSGSNSQQASTAMYQLSQALASGKVSLMDWNSVVNAGLGGKVFQEALKDTARQHGVAVDEIVKKSGSFRDSLQEGWITSSVLTETLSKFTGDLSLAQIKAMGYTDQEAAGILEMGKTAQEAATKVKTMSQLIGTLREAAGSGWSKSFQLIFGDFNQARDLFTSVNNVLGGMIQSSSDARNKVLGDWNAMGGRTVLIQAISNAFTALITVLKPIKDAFREIFPAKTGADLYYLTQTLRQFTAGLIIGASTVDNLKRTFAGVFAVFDIIKMAVSAALSAFLSLFDGIGKGTGGVLSFTAGIGDMLVSFRDAIKSGNAFGVFFNAIASAIKTVLSVIGNLASGFASLFDGVKGGEGDRFAGSLDSAGSALAKIVAVGQKVKDFFRNLGGIMVNLSSQIGTAMGGLGQSIGQALAKIDFNKVLGVVQTGLLASIALMIKNLFAGGLKVDVGGGLFDKVKGTLDGVTGSLEAMQSNLKSDILLKIAGALALLTASIVALSMVPAADLAKAMGALALGYVGMQAALVSLSNAVGLMGTLKLPVLAASLVALAAGLILVAIAMKIMASINGEDMTRSLYLLGGSLLIIKTTMQAMSKDSSGMIKAAAAITILAVALNILAIALKIMASMSLGEMTKALTTLAVSLGVIAVAMNLMPTSGMISAGAGIAILAAGLVILAVALKIMASMSLGEMAKGLITVAAALGIIAVAMNLMPKDMLLQSVALIAVGAALNLIALAVKSMGGMSWSEIAKGLITLAGSLAILAVALILMNGTIAGAAALLVASAALAILTPVLIALGSLDWTTILTALAALAGVFVVLGVAGLLLTPLVPVILGLSVAMVLIGAGLALAGVGALAFATAFALVVSVGAAGVAVLAGILTTFIASIPLALAAFGQGIIALANIIATGGPAFVAAFSAVLRSILMAIIINTPLIGLAFLTLVNTALNVLVVATPKIAAAGLKIIIDLISIMAANVGRIASVATDFIVKFMGALGDNAPRLIDAGVQLVLKLINGVASAIRTHSSELGAAGANLASAIVEGMVRGLASGISVIANKAKEVAKSALNAAKSILGINSPSKEFEKIGLYSNQGFASGLDRYSTLSTKAAENVGTSAIDSLKDKLKNATFTVLDNIDASPVIRPVMDLSAVLKGTKQMESLLPTGFLENQMSTMNAQQALNGYYDNKQAVVDTADPKFKDTSNTGTIQFIQNNTSPKSLDRIEIYRQTRNQLSKVKGALA